MGAGLRDLNLTTYPWDEERMEPDVDAACKTIREVQPKVACSDNRCSCFPRPLRKWLQQQRKSVLRSCTTAKYVLGLIAGGQFQDPLREGAI